MSASCSMAPDLAEVGHAGAAVLAVLDGAVELRERDHRHLQLAGQRLEPAADLGDLLLAAVARLLGVDELDVIDHDQAEVLAQLEPPGVGRDLEHVPRGGVVDEERRRPQLVVALAQQGHLAGARGSARSGACGRRPATGAEEPLGQLELAHFQADEEHGDLAGRRRRGRRCSAPARSCPCSAGRPG